MEFNPRLHGLRAIAALGVLIFHWAQFFPVHAQLHEQTQVFGLFWHISLFVGFGWMGVPLFFVLSGYLLTCQWQTRPLVAANLKHFWLRRFLRIYPGVWAQLLLLLLLATVFPFLAKVKDWGHLLANATLFLHLPPGFYAPINGVWWTLPVELGFYLLLPGFVAIQRRLGWLLVVGMGFLISFGWRYLLVTQVETGNHGVYQVYLDALPGSLVYFCAGFAAAYLPLLSSARARQALLVILLLGLYLALLYLAFRLDSYWAGSWLLICWPLLAAPLVAGLMWTLLRPLPFTGLLSSRLLVRLGEISFGLYLWHFPVFQLQSHFWPERWQGLGFSFLGLLTGFILTCVLAELSFRWVESPLMRWRRIPAARE